MTDPVSSRSALDVVEGVDLTGKTCVITGASSGLGRESARALASTGVRLVLAARNRPALEETSTWIREQVPRSQISLVELDLTSLAGVRRAAGTIAAQAPVVDILMNNAGVMFAPFGRTEDGFEMQFGTNHLGHFELTRHLLPELLAADHARVVNLSSDGHLLSDVDLDDPNWRRRSYDKFLAYGASKTANIQHAVELDRRHREDGVRAFAVHPGVVATALARHMSGSDLAKLGEITPAHTPASGVSADILAGIVGPEQGAATQVWAATTPDLDGRGGLYLADCAVRDDAAPYALGPQKAADLWALSEDLCAA